MMPEPAGSSSTSETWRVVARSGIISSPPETAMDCTLLSPYEPSELRRTSPQKECVPALALTLSERISNEVKRVSANADPPQV